MEPAVATDVPAAQAAGEEERPSLLNMQPELIETILRKMTLCDAPDEPWLDGRAVCAVRGVCRQLNRAVTAPDGDRSPLIADARVSWCGALYSLECWARLLDARRDDLSGVPVELNSVGDSTQWEKEKKGKKRVKRAVCCLCGENAVNRGQRGMITLTCHDKPVPRPEAEIAVDTDDYVAIDEERTFALCMPCLRLVWGEDEPVDGGDFNRAMGPEMAHVKAMMGCTTKPSHPAGVRVGGRRMDVALVRNGSTSLRAPPAGFTGFGTLLPGSQPFSVLAESMH